jgi:hypothetical protein
MYDSQRIGRKICREYLVESGTDYEDTGRVKVAGRLPVGAIGGDVEKFFNDGALSVQIKFENKTVWYRRVDG